MIFSAIVKKKSVERVRSFVEGGKLKLIEYPICYTVFKMQVTRGTPLNFRNCLQSLVNAKRFSLT